MTSTLPKPTAEAPGTYGSSFVLPITRDDRVLLARQRRVKGGTDETKLALLGGKALANEDSFQCASREALEETGGALSEVTRLRLARGAGVKATADYAGPQQPSETRSVAVAHDLVVTADLDIDQRFDGKEAVRLRALSETKAPPVRPTTGKRKRASNTTTEQLGLVFVPLADIRRREWREEKMLTYPHSVLTARLLNQLLR